MLMERAQGGDTVAYRRLLEEIAPYVRSLAAKRCREPDEVEEIVQDTLLTIHAIRQTYDPVRPFGPWLVAITKRRMADRLRRNSLQRQRETPLTGEHETFLSRKRTILRTPPSAAHWDGPSTSCRLVSVKRSSCSS